MFPVMPSSKIIKIVQTIQESGQEVFFKKTLLTSSPPELLTLMVKVTNNFTQMLLTRHSIKFAQFSETYHTAPLKINYHGS